MRYAWPLLLLFVLPASAQEYEVIITGDASQGSSSTSSPFDVTFDFNVSSPTQSYIFAGGCLSSFSANLAITGLSSTIGGQPTGLSGSSMSFSGGQLGGGTCNAIESTLLIGSSGGLILTLQSPPTTSLGTYPILDLLGGGPQSGSLDGYNLNDIDIDVKAAPVGVPEPGTLALLALAALSLVAVHARRILRARA